MSSGLFSDPRSFDQHLRGAWVELTNQHFHSAEQVAVFFGVTERAARNWRDGVSGPKGGAVAYAIKNLPGAVVIHAFGSWWFASAVGRGARALARREEKSGEKS